MNKASAILLALLIILSPVFGNGSTEAAIPATGNTYIDDLGREVTISKAERVSILIGSFADVWCLSGGKDSIVSAAGDTWTQFNLDLDEEVVDIGSVRKPNLEKILASNPDLVIASSKTEADLALMDTFEAMGIPVLYFDVSTFEDYLHMLDICTDITGGKDNYNRYGLALRDEIEKARAMQDGSHPRVLYVRASSSGVKVKNSERSVLGVMLKDLGCINIADSNTELLENLSMETIIKEDPDWIFGVIQSSTPEKAERALQKTLLSDPAWNGLTAVREGRFIMLPQDLYNMKPNARWAEAYTRLARILYE